MIELDRGKTDPFSSSNPLWDTKYAEAKQLYEVGANRRRFDAECPFLPVKR